MTTELTQCPDCGKPSNNGRTCRLCDSEDALHKALTQRPAAQTERDAFEAWARPNGYDLRRNDVLGHYSSIDTSRAWSGFRAGRASLPAPQQATPEPVGEPFGWVCRYLCHADDDCEQRWTDWHFTLSSESVPPKWSRGSYATQEAVPVFTRPAPVETTPVGEATIGRWLYEKWWAEYGKLADVDKPYYTFDELPEKQRAAYESLALMLTRPAPGVPESPCQLRKRFEQHMRDVFACKDTAFLSIDGGKTYLDGSMDNHWRTWLAAQAKGEVLAWSPALAQAEFNRAIDFAIKEGIGAAIFLDAWRHGDTSEWPEFAAAQAKGVD